MNLNKTDRKETITTLYATDVKNNSGHTHFDYEKVFEEITCKCPEFSPVVKSISSISTRRRGELKILNDRIRNGDSEASNRLTEIYMRTALAYGLKLSKEYDMELQDAIQEALAGLLEAVRAYNPESGTTIELTIHQKIKRAVLNAQPDYKRRLLPENNMNRSGHAGEECWNEKLAALEPVPLEACLDGTACVGQNYILTGDASVEAEDNLAKDRLVNEVQKVLHKLNSKQKNAIDNYYGTGGGQEHTFRRIGEKSGVTAGTIQMHKTRAMKRLRVIGKHLKIFL